MIVMRDRDSRACVSDRRRDRFALRHFITSVPSLPWNSDFPDNIAVSDNIDGLHTRMTSWVAEKSRISERVDTEDKSWQEDISSRWHLTVVIIIVIIVHRAYKQISVEQDNTLTISKRAMRSS